MKIFFLFSFIFILTNLQGQTVTNYERSYKNGKDLYDLEKYALAMEALRPLTRQDAGNPYTEYASFYFALSAFKEGQSNMAKDMFLQISQRYPNWENLDEVHYWLSTIYFDQGAYDQALKASAKIKNSNKNKDVIEMKSFFLNEINDLEILKELLQQNPYDAEVAKVLAKKISERPVLGKNAQLLDFLISEFKLDKEKYRSNTLKTSVKKNEYNVAVFFPFMNEELDQERNVRTNQFVLDTYHGIQLAVEELKNEGKNINLHAYDTKRDSLTTARILKEPEIRQMDLIIGPLYPVTSKLVSDYTYKYKINMLNPLSNNSEVIGGNPMSFLFKPSLETQAKAAAEYASTNFGANKNVMIVYGKTPKDSIMAFNYQQTAENNGLKVMSITEIGASKAKQLLKLLTTSSTVLAGDTIKSKPGHIFIASSDEMVVANAISALEMRGDKLPVIATEDWLDLKFVSFEQLERLQVKFISPSYVNYERAEVNSFRESYIRKTNLLPSQYAYIGYDMMLYFGDLLFKEGNYFQQGFDKQTFTEGKIFPGYRYDDNNSNQFVPIVQFNTAILELQNSPR